MIKEYAFGLSNRHHFGDVQDVEKWIGMAQDTFMSLWDYDNHVIDYVKKKGTLASYDGMLYMPDEFILDVDGENPESARQKTNGLSILLNDPTGKNPVIQYDDEVTNLVGTRVNVLFVKKTSTTDGKEYSETFDLVPVVQETEHIIYTDDDVARLKKSVEKQYARKTATTTNGVGTVNLDTTTTATSDTELPF